MPTRNILDSLGNVIGTMTFAGSPSEEQWSGYLAPYATALTTPPVRPIIPTILKTASDTVTTSSATASVVGSMLDKPIKGAYIALFSGAISTSGASAQGEFGLYVDGVLLPETKRPISCNLQLLGGLVSISLNTIGVGTNTGTEVELNGDQALEVRFRSTNGGTIGFAERTLSLMKVR